MMDLDDDNMSDTPPRSIESDASDADERSVPGSGEQARVLLALEEEGWPHRHGNCMALISCE